MNISVLDSEWLTLVAAAQMTNYHPGSLRRLYKQGDVRGTKVGNKLYFRKSDMESVSKPVRRKKKEGELIKVTRLAPGDSKFEIGGSFRVFLLGVRVQVTAWDRKFTVKVGKDIAVAGDVT
jgi:hypothetical protein